MNLFEDLMMDQNQIDVLIDQEKIQHDQGKTLILQA
jgi:hypothetical protein